jgi:hypothetical protein
MKKKLIKDQHIIWMTMILSILILVFYLLSYTESDGEYTFTLYTYNEGMKWEFLESNKKHCLISYEFHCKLNSDMLLAP